VIAVIERPKSFETRRNGGNGGVGKDRVIARDRVIVRDRKAGPTAAYFQREPNHTEEIVSCSPF
jgi:hypothetical protein